MQELDTSILTIKTLLFVEHQGSSHWVLTPNPQGYPLPVEMRSPPRRAAYVPAGGDLDQAIRNASAFLDNKNQPVLAFLSSDAGGALVTSRIFVYAASESVAVASNLSGRPTTRYIAPRNDSSYSWVSDWTQGRPGYFLTGQGNVSALWKLARLEVDAFGGSLLTLKAIQLFGDLPDLALDAIKEPIVRSEMAEHYKELQSALASHSFRAVVTHARDIVEPVAAELLRRIGEQPGRDLGSHLRVFKKRRDQGAEIEAFSDLSYHLAHKIRLLHARTHPEGAEDHGRPLDPELALSCVEDLKLILRESNLTAEQARGANG